MDVLWSQRQAERYEGLLGSLEWDHSPLAQHPEILRAMAGEARQAGCPLRDLLEVGSGREAA